MYRIDFWTLWEKARVGCFKRTALKQVYYQGWNRSPAQVGCMRQVLRAGALGRPRGMEWGGRWEGGSGWGTHVNPWLIHVNVWQKPLQYFNYPPANKNKWKKKKDWLNFRWNSVTKYILPTIYTRHISLNQKVSPHWSVLASTLDFQLELKQFLLETTVALSR